MLLDEVTFSVKFATNVCRSFRRSLCTCTARERLFRGLQTFPIGLIDGNRSDLNEGLVFARGVDGDLLNGSGFVPYLPECQSHKATTCGREVTSWTAVLGSNVLLMRAADRSPSNLRHHFILTVDINEERRLSRVSGDASCSIPSPFIAERSVQIVSPWSMEMSD